MSTLISRLNPASRLTYLRDLLSVLVSRDLKLRYKRSALGFGWSLLNPFAQMLVLSFVFSRVLPLNIPDYPAFLISGLLVWGWFSSALYQSTDAIVGNRELIRRPGFPPAILPVVTVASQLVHFLLALPVLFVFLAFNHIPLSIAYLALPVLIAIQFVFTLSLAYLASTFHVTYRDTQYLLGIFLLLGFYITPALLGGGRVIMIAVLIEQQVREALNWPFAAALSAVLLVATFAVYALAQRFTQPEART
jgi:lipopolysaccharide transport system permease protein